MKIKKRINAASLLAAASLTFSPSAWSLGLGDITVESFLNQPLQVKIDLISRETDDLTSITARLASAEDYAMIGASLESVPVPIGFSVEDIDGDAYILGTSSLPIGEPVVRLIVEVNWASGRLLREYTLFLDPPSFSDPAPIPRIDKREVAAPVASTATVQPVEEPAQADSEAQNATPGDAKSTQAATAARAPVEGEYGPVGNGETLWGIASNWARGTDLNINQVMIAIQRENPQAFLKDNINLLKRGAILRMPRVEDVRAISAAAAINAVAEQADEFRGARPAASVASPATPLLAEEIAVAESEEIEQQVDATLLADEAEEAEVIADEMTTQEPELAPQLELVPPSAESDLDSAYGFEESEDSSVDASVAVTTLREDLARTEEELITQQQQNEYLAERIKELESQLSSAEQGNVEDPNMANMEERLRQQRLAEAAAAKDKDAPWYSGIWGWLIGLLVIVAAIAGWLFSRRGSGDAFAPVAEDQQLREIQDEAEEVLRVLKDPGEPGSTADTAENGDTQAQESAGPAKSKS